MNNISSVCVTVGTFGREQGTTVARHNDVHCNDTEVSCVTGPFHLAAWELTGIPTLQLCTHGHGR